MTFSFLAAMKWNHLPEDGGVNNQHPILMERFRDIHRALADEDEKQRKKQEREVKNQSRGANRRR